MRLNITVDGMNRLANHVKNAQEPDLEAEEELADIDMEHMAVTHEILMKAHDAFMKVVNDGLAEAENQGYLGKNVKGQLVDVLSVFEDEGESIKDRLIDLEEAYSVQ